ncbi:MAG: ADP-ribosylglycohydrolase family protein [Candidatus Competibacteraceae bacterium]
MTSEHDRFRGCLLGLACGDAIGATVEFHPRGTFPPVTDMIGGGPFRLEPGQWTDDTSMALCLASSLVETGRFDPRDQMERYWRWYSRGALSSTGHCFDIGNATEAALLRFHQGGEPYSGSSHPNSAGSRCLMRLAPVPMFAYPDPSLAIQLSGASARTTHAAPECIQASQLFGAILHQALAGLDRDAILFGSHFPDAGSEALSPRLASIARGDYRDKTEGEIRGSGYVVECLEAALWCFYQTGDFREAILKAVNLGDDADTTAAVCGQIAGACYGESGIPEPWRRRLTWHDLIAGLADRLWALR